jgi:hypothetical protein
VTAAVNVTLLRPIISIVAILWALLAKAPTPLKVYFAAQLINTVLLETAFGRVSSSMYEMLYSAGFALIFWAMGELVWKTVRSKIVFVTSGIVTAGVLYMASTGIHLWNEAVLIVMGEAALLAFSGVALAFSVPFMRPEGKRVYGSLVVLWFALAAFDFCFAARLPMTSFLNHWLPTWCLVGVMLYLGWMLRHGDVRSTAHAAAN